METALQKTEPGNLRMPTVESNQQSEIVRLIAENPRLRSIARIIAVKVNSLYAYPLGKSQIEDWVEIINELMPDLTPEELNKKINKAITGEFDWDLKKGIQNLFRVVEGPWESYGNKRRMTAESEWKEIREKEEEERFRMYDLERRKRHNLENPLPKTVV